MSLFGGVSGSGSGPTGPAGADGNTVLYDAGAPSSGVGLNGNFYIDTTAHAIYGPKVGGSWGSSTALVGPQGSQGVQGNAGLDGDQVIYGSGAPANGTGQDGDTYIDNTGHVLYGPKAAGAWPAGVSLVGPQGTTGDAPLLPMIVWGNGSDGDLVMSSGAVTLTRDMYYNNLTLSGTAKIQTNGYRVHVATLLDISNAGVDALWNGATDASQTAAGQSTLYITGLGAPGQLGEFNGGNSSSSSPAGTTGVGTQASAVSSIVFCMGGLGGQGGAGGASGSGNAGGAARLGTSATRVIVRRFDWRFQRAGSTLFGGQSGPSGSTGGGDGVNAANAGPLGGCSGGNVWIAAKTIKRGASTAVGAISARGGAAMNVTTPLSTGTIGGSSGGGGGGGGCVLVAYQFLTGAQSTNAIDVSGGAAGNGLPGASTGKGGQGGQGGNNGTILICDFTAQTVTEAVIPSGSMPSIPAVPSTSAGSNGSAGNIGRYAL